MIQKVQTLARQYIWETSYRAAPVWQRALVGAARMVILIARDIAQGDLQMRAMSLVYTTLLSLVPLLALSFSILKGFGVQNRLDDTLRTALAPLGNEKALQLTDNIISFVNNMNVGVLGAVGLIFLVYTVVSLMQKIESAFNHVWHINNDRSFGERFTTFLSAITIGPLLVFAAIAVTGSAMNTALMEYLRSTWLLGEAIDVIARLVPFALVITAFTFFYTFIPNTRVKLGAALTGGVVAGLLWETLGVAFASFAAGASKYQAIYATFASAILFMIWLYLNWLILLIGASIAFYRQNPEVLATGLRKVHFSPRLTERYAVSLLATIGSRFYAKEPPYTLAELAELYQVPGHALGHVVSLLAAVGVLAETDDEEPRYVPAVPLDTTELATVLREINVFQPERTYAPPLAADETVTAIEAALIDGKRQALRGLTLKALAASHDVAAVADGEGDSASGEASHNDDEHSGSAEASHNDSEDSGSGEGPEDEDSASGEASHDDEESAPGEASRRGGEL